MNNKIIDIKNVKKEIQDERIELSIRQFLLCLVDLPMKLFAGHPYYTYKKMYYGYRNWRRKDQIRYYNMLYRLKIRELIIFDQEETKSGRLPKLTKKGKQKALEYAAREIAPLRPKLWDRKWRVVIFDIPIKKNRNRNFVRRELRRIGFYKLQDSVFVYPFQCKKEIDFIRLAAGLSKYNLCYLRVDNFDLSPKVLDYFIRQDLINVKEINR